MVNVHEPPAYDRLLRAAVVVLLVASLLPLAAAIRVDYRFPSDDALISLTFAKNIARGNGFVYNAPPPVLATTTPAFTLAVAGITAVTGIEPTVVAHWLTASCWLGVIWSFFFFREAFGLDVIQAAVIGWLVAAQGWIGSLGMEAYPFALALVVAAGLTWSGRVFLGGAAVGLLFLIRGEGALFGVILGVVVLARELRGPKTGERSPTLMYVAGGALPVLVWAGYALPTFGSILPATLTAKMAQVASGLWAPFIERFVGHWLPGWGVGPWGVVSTVLGYTLIVLGLVEIVRKIPRMAVFPIWSLAYVVGYWALGVPGYSWYRFPVFLVFSVVAGMGLTAAWRVLSGYPGDRPYRSIVAILILVVVMLGASVKTVREIVKPPVDDRGPAYLNIARWLNTHAETGQSVAFIEVGALGYYTNMKVIDLVGLVTPSVIPHVLDRDFSTGFWENVPDFLIVSEGSEFTRGIVENPLFSACYGTVAEFEGPAGKRLTVFRSRETRNLDLGADSVTLNW